jgi:hypothetical protein
MLEYKAIQKVDYKESGVDVYTLWEFLDFVWADNINPEYGIIAKIVIDGFKTDLNVKEYALMLSKFKKTTLKELCNFSFENPDLLVEIFWREF